jgi:hypothetical protein
MSILPSIEAKLKTRPQTGVTVDADQILRLEAVERNLAILIELLEAQFPGISQTIEERRSGLENGEAATLASLADTLSPAPE